MNQLYGPPPRRCRACHVDMWQLIYLRAFPTRSIVPTFFTPSPIISTPSQKENTGACVETVVIYVTMEIWVVMNF